MAAAETALLTETTQAICGRCHQRIADQQERCPRCTGKPTHPARIGPWQVLDVIGRGPASVVYLCADADGSATLAVKVYDAPDPTGRALAERRLREVRSWARLKHPAAARVRAIGRSQGFPFVAMERALSGSVGDAVAAGCRFEPHVALAIVAEAARGLEAATASGLMHRAIKPENLLLGAGGSVWLTDPGSPVGGPQRRATPVAGGFALQAPELDGAGAADFRADMYALGMTLARMIGALDPARPGAPVIEPAPAVAQLLLRLTAHRREDRYGTWSELRTALAQALESVDPARRDRAGAAARSWATAGALAGFVAAAAISAFLPPPEPALAGGAVSSRRIHAAAPIAPPPASPDPAADIADAVPAILHRDIEGPASYAFVMGSEEARLSFDIEGEAHGGRRPKRMGGRLRVPPGAAVTWLHQSDVEGDLRAEADLVLDARASGGLLLRTADGREIVARVRAWSARPSLAERSALASTPSLDPDAGVLLLAGAPAEPLAGVRLGVAPGVPHHLELHRRGDETRLFVDGREMLRTDAPLGSPFRVGLLAPEGGIELRSFAYSADRELAPPPAG